MESARRLDRRGTGVKRDGFTGNGGRCESCGGCVARSRKRRIATRRFRRGHAAGATARARSATVSAVTAIKPLTSAKVP